MIQNERRDARSVQWPFVGVAILLVILILLTPNLLQSGNSAAAGSLQARAELIVDHPAARNTTYFYLESFGATARYQTVDIGLASGFSWPFTKSPSSLTRWTWWNATDVLVATVSNRSSSVAVNITVQYTDSANVTAYYVGLYAFNFNSTTQTFYGIALISGISAPPSPFPFGKFPIYLLLHETSTLRGQS